MAATQKDQGQIALAHTLSHVPWCDEYENMISGMLYNSLHPTLSSARFRARKWSHEYNTTFPTSEASLASERYARLQTIIGNLGPGAYIEPPFQIDYGCNIVLGSRFYAGFNLTILDCAIVTIGNRVMMGPNVSIFAATHEVEVQSRREDIEYAKPVWIGDDCWIGGHAVILPGVRIGKGVTVAAASVVTKDVEDWSVVAGSPARVIKKVKPVPDLPGDSEGDDGAVQEGKVVEV